MKTRKTKRAARQGGADCSALIMQWRTEANRIKGFKPGRHNFVLGEMYALLRCANELEQVFIIPNASHHAEATEGRR